MIRTTIRLVLLVGGALAIAASGAEVRLPDALLAAAADDALRAPDLQAFGGADPEERFTIDPADHPDGEPVVFANLLQFRDALDRRELISAINALPLDQDMRKSFLAAAAREFPGFVQRHNEARRLHCARYLDACASLAKRIAEGGAVRERTTELNTVDRLRNSLASELERIELEFLDSVVEAVASLMAEHDGTRAPIDEARRHVADRLEGLYLRAQRRWHRDGIPTVRGAELDLRRELEAIDLALAERAAIEPRLVELERFVCARQQARCRAYWSSLPRVSRAIAAAQAGERGVESATASTQRAFGVQVSFAREIRAANEQCVEAVATACSVEHARQIRLHVRCVVFPELYPDERSEQVERSYREQLARLEGDSPEARSMHAEHAAWRSAYESVCRELERELLAWTDREAELAPGHDHEERAEFAATLLKRRGMFVQVPTF